MNAQEIKKQLAELGIRPAHIRGQNFLIDERVLDDIVAAAEIKEHETVLEIGPGLGALTRKLLDRVGQVVAIELDPTLAKHLEAALGPRGLKLIRGDAREVDVSAMIGSLTKQYKVVANIPYNITSDILQKFLLSQPAPDVIVLLIQREVAERVTAAPPNMSRLGVMVQYFGKAEVVRDVPSDAFWPKPKVESAVLRIRRYPQEVLRQREVIINRENFFRLVEVGFSSPRKKLAGNLAAGLHKDRKVIVAALEKLGIDPNTRAESLTVNDWLSLAPLIK